MAKGMKRGLSAEELLEVVLVPEDEQPYEVPDNWVWTRLGIIAKWGSGGTPSRKVPEYFHGQIPWLKTGELNNGIIYDSEEKITEDAVKNSSAKIFPVNTVVLAMYGATIGKVGILGVQATTNQACACAVPYSSLDFKYLFYYLIGEKDNFIRKGKGGAQPNISQEIIKDHIVPHPPLSEQHRIVDRIENFFAKLDQAKELAQNALDSFETRKAAILHKAFSGELTAKWREKHGVGMDSWEEKKLGDVCTSLQYGTSNKSSTEGKVVVIRMGNLQDGEIDWTNLAYTDNQEDINKYLLQPGDVLFNRTNSPELVGKTSIYRGEYPAIFAGYIIRLKYDKHINGEYLNYIMNSVRAKEYCNAVKSDGVNQSNINAKKIAAFTIPVPSLEEQQEIVRILNRILDSEKNAKGITDVIDRIDQMKKAILSRAFRGELGTNDPNEGSAWDLLKEVIVHNSRAIVIVS